MRPVFTKRGLPEVRGTETTAGYLKKDSPGKTSSGLDASPELSFSS